MVGTSNKSVPEMAIESMAISGTDLLEVPIPYIFGLFSRRKFQGISPLNQWGIQNM